MAGEASLAPRPTNAEAPSQARVVTGPIEGAVRRVVEPPPEPQVKAPKGPKVEGPEGTSDSYTPDEGHPIEAPAVEEGKVVALGGAVEGRAGILDSAQADAEALRQQAAEERRAQDEMVATQSVQRKASSLPGSPAGGGGGPAPAAPPAGLDATAGDEAAIRAQAAAEFSGFSAGAREWSPKGGGGGGSPVVAKPPPPAPNVAGREPASALAALGALPPAQILGAMGGVAAAATKAVGKKEKALASAPPTKRIAPGPAGPGAPPAKPTIDAKVEEVKPSGGKAPEVKAGAEQVEAPPIILSGETDPANVAAQHAAGKAAAAAASNKAKAGLATPRGEERLHPKVKAQTVKPPVTVGGGGVQVASEGVGQVEASIVAFQEKPGELHQAVAKGSGQLSKAAAEASKKEAKEHKESDREIKKAEADHAKEMKEEQAKGRKEVAKERKKADSQHAKLVSSHSKEATAKKADAITKVKTEKAKGDTDAKREVREANKKIASEKRKGEEKARKAEEEEKKKDSGGGVWGAIKRGASAVASAVKSAVKAVVDAVKSAVKSIVTAVVSTVGSVLKGVWNAIKSVVKAALDVIKKLASAFLDALKALIDAALALIDSLIKAALAALQALANLLPGVLGKLLGALVSALKAVYDALKAAYKAAIEAVKSAVKAVVSWAKSAIAAFGMLAALVKDIAAGPGRWFSNLIASAKDGIMNHLWGALKGAVKAWWDGKVKNLIGAPQEVLALLVKGGITFAMVLTMAWEAIKAALPELIIQQLIEKVVSALNVGAGTALLLLRALQAAWASIGAIVGAIQKFFGFLRAVKGGGAGPQFAVAVAAGAVAVIEFVSNFLMARLGSKLKPFKDKLSGLAKKIAEKLLGATKKAGSRIVKAGKVVLDNVRSSKLGKIVERGVGKAGGLKKKYDTWKYGTKDGTSKWAGAEAAEDAAWSQKVHQKTGGRFGTAAPTSSTPHHTTGGDTTDTTSTATKPDPDTDGLGTNRRPGEYADRTSSTHASADGSKDIKVRDDGLITACQRAERLRPGCSIVGQQGKDESDAEALERTTKLEHGDDVGPTGKQDLDDAEKIAAIPQRVPTEPDRYEPLRRITDGSDIERISAHTGLTTAEVEAAKNHLMFDEHVLVDNDTYEVFRGRFEPDEQIAKVWERAARGETLAKADIDFLHRLIRHEQAEGAILAASSTTLRRDFIEGTLEGKLRTALVSSGKWDAAAIDRMLDLENKPVTPYRYAHLLAAAQGAPNPS